MSNIKKGDIVCLKSGGPEMTVQEITKFTDGFDKATCVWFNNANEEALTKVFDIEALKISSN